MVRFDFLGPQSAEGVHAWIQRHLPPGDYPQLVRPFNWSKLITTITILIGVFTLGTVAYPYILPVLQNRNLWALLSLIMVLMFTSGHMYNHIRKVPYVTGNGRGGITYFAGGFSNQFGIETQIIAAVCELWLRSTKASANMTRCHPLLRYDFSRIESTENERCKNATDCSYCLGKCGVWHVQLFNEHIQDQEWWLSVLVAAFLVSGIRGATMYKQQKLIEFILSSQLPDQQ